MLCVEGNTSLKISLETSDRKQQRKLTQTTSVTRPQVPTYSFLDPSCCKSSVNLERSPHKAPRVTRATRSNPRQAPRQAPRHPRSAEIGSDRRRLRIRWRRVGSSNPTSAARQRDPGTARSDVEGRFRGASREDAVKTTDAEGRMRGRLKRKGAGKRLASLRGRGTLECSYPEEMTSIRNECRCLLGMCLLWCFCRLLVVQNDMLRPVQRLLRSCSSKLRVRPPPSLSGAIH